MMQQEWAELDNTIRTWWDGDMRTAQEKDICASGPDWTMSQTIANIGGKKADDTPASTDEPTLLFLPFPFSPAAGNQGAYPEMFAWDTFFINCAMLAHGRFDLVRDQILNQLFMILRHGWVLNANRSYFLTRSQPPLHPESIWRYYQATGDIDILFLAYPLLRREYQGYWLAEHHQTPTGLATNRDLGDPNLRNELASLAETGLDFCACFGEDIRQCVPIATNCQLVRYAQVLSQIATVLKLDDEASAWQRDADERSERIRKFCWNEQEGFFFEYNYSQERQIPVWSLCAYWTLWAGVATSQQASCLAENLKRFEHEYGIAFTDKLYASPFAEFRTLQWSYPYNWPPLAIMAVEALDKGGFQTEARRVGQKFLGLMLRQYEKTGKLWEKYIVVPGQAEQSPERYDTPPFHGWASAAVVLIGRTIGLSEDAERG
jgi:alpha,alpha-trehalase